MVQSFEQRNNLQRDKIKLPQNLQQYKGSYIILQQAVYYINIDGQAQLISDRKGCN